MNREQAKLILQVWRPGDTAEDDPQLAEALALAKADPELAEWFAREQQWDAAWRARLKTVPVPPELKAHILAGQNIVPLPKPPRETTFFSWHPTFAWAVAAAFIIFAGIAGYQRFSHVPAASLAAFTRAMIAASPLDAHHVDVENSNFAEVKHWLADHHAIADIDLPSAIKNAPGLMGCRAMDWHGHRVSMLCFVMNGSQHMDLFVAPVSALTDAAPSGQPRFAAVDQQMTASWQENGNVYLIAGKVPEEFLRHCLQASGGNCGFLASL